MELDMLMILEQRWRHMWKLIELAIAFSPTKQLKVFEEDDSSSRLKGQNDFVL